MQRRTLRSLRKRKQRKRWVFICVLLLLITGAGAGSAHLAKEHLRVKEVVCTGNRHMKNEEMKSLMRLREGSPIFESSGRELSTRLRKSPWIRDASVKKDPSGRVTVRVVEATPVAVLYLRNRPYLVDREGTLLEEMKDESPLFLPVVREIDPAKQGDTYGEALKLVRFLQKRGGVSYGGALEISGSRPEEIVLRIDDIPVKVGAGEYERKLERLQFIKDEIKRRNIAVEYIDVRFADEIILKQVKEEPPRRENPVTQRSNAKEKQKKIRRR
ncbi:MAG: cell division protein FtsQ/DivIB [Chloroflexota bacterium]